MCTGLIDWLAGWLAERLAGWLADVSACRCAVSILTAYDSAPLELASSSPERPSPSIDPSPSPEKESSSLSRWTLILYFCACERTCTAVRVPTTSATLVHERPWMALPLRKSSCSSGVHLEAAVLSLPCAFGFGR
eukprot:CAMPEP_0119475958 /NCGR_PEP_ID=MMETSP1344-20130328/6663_1 /TAXON_ID=236787 /ORGANISM="Florenciella parvula, Strain CCMP2471" /LENGTH=134 /DNA_ID=CAMNT_0007509623 /DNA_START=840 /DNA_END=1244 /DNA_ORIENTATION=-